LEAQVVTVLGFDVVRWVIFIDDLFKPEEDSMAKKIREFMTHRDPDEHIWVEREETAVIGTARMGQRIVPKIRPFDLLRSAPRSANRARVTIWEGDTLRIATESLDGMEEQLTRAADHDVIFLQFSGHSKVESECGVVELNPGETLLPAAISHRSAGSDDCLRVRVASRELLSLGVDPEKPLTQTKFTVKPSEPFTANGNGKLKGKNATLEHISFWDPQSDVWIERDAAALIGTVTDGSRPVKKIAAFDYFTGMTGKGGARAPILYNGKELRVDVYNLEEEQRGFHRGCDEDEIWFQFRGHSLNHTEWGAMELEAGRTAMIPRGIAHRITGSPGFLRMVFYSRGIVQPKAFNNVSERETRFEVQ
jgi:mannose-6-phosphate isomerase-like protein (cupin superfamily)